MRKKYNTATLIIWPYLTIYNYYDTHTDKGKWGLYDQTDPEGRVGETIFLLYKALEDIGSKCPLPTGLIQSRSCDVCDMDEILLFPAHRCPSM